MFKIILSPLACPVDDAPPTVSGDVLSYRGEQYDFTQLLDGAEIEVGSPFIGPVRRVNGEIQCKLEYQYNWDTSEDHQSRNWDDYTFTVLEGQCPCPIKRRAKQQEVADNE